ncbi:MAG: threonylcarbamoyl-AMP synthase [Bradyrhizobiaceae bacterium]|nr:threonylcarbamoyl-AMP synthase [Bradyrhizobiaceae bacterium]
MKHRARVVPADSAGIAEAARVLAGGGLVAFPTETVYGLGADATDARAVARLYAAKERPTFNPLIAHLASADAAKEIGRLNATASRLAEKFWPGPLTLVVPALPRCPVCELARAGLDTVALRVPAHPVANPLLRAVGKPVVAPSANRSGHVSPTTAVHVLTDLRDRIDLVLDGGPTPLGLESTILDCTREQPRMLRPGTIPRGDIEEFLGMAIADSMPVGGEAPAAPGQLASHYATRAKLRLDADSVRPDEALLAFGPSLPQGAERTAYVLNLSPNGDLVEAAANLFAHLRALDATDVHAIAVAPIPTTGLGEAIRDRLLRAAAPRP